MRNHSIKTPAKATSKAVTVYKPKQDSDAIKIGKLYQLARTSLVDSMKHSIECAKQEKLDHGEWLPWLEANAKVLGFENRRTASRLMSFASNGALASHLNEGNAVTISRQVWGHDNYRTIGTGNNEWHTPENCLIAVRDVLGTIDLDPASNAIAQRTVNAKNYFTIAQDGLTKEGRGKVFLNPPYEHSAIAGFVSKLCEEYTAGHVTEAIMLTHNNSDTQWFHQAVKISEVFCLTEGRIRFVDSSGNLASPTNGQVFFYFGNHPQVFSARFREFGFIATAYAAVQS